MNISGEIVNSGTIIPASIYSRELIISFKGCRLTQTLDASQYIDCMEDDDERKFMIGLNDRDEKSLMIDDSDEKKLFNIEGDRGYIYVLISGHRAVVTVYIKKEYRKKTLAIYAMTAIGFYVFDTIGVMKIEAGTTSKHRESLRLQEGFFEREGILKMSYFEKNKFYDIHLFGLLRTQFNLKYRKRRERYYKIESYK